MTVILALPVITGCSDLKTTPVSWNDIARTIPSNPNYIAAVNVNFEVDSAFNNIWGDSDVLSLLTKGLALDTVRPSHFVVVGTDYATFITWPVPNPEFVAEEISDWKQTSLNNTVDAHIFVKGKGSIVVSSTQIWVVDNANGADNVNTLLSAAMDTKASNIPVFERCITDTPQEVAAVIPHGEKYYALDMHHEEGQLRLDVDAYDYLDKRLDIIDNLGRLPYAFVDRLSEVSPFVAMEVEKGTFPALLKKTATLISDRQVRVGLNAVAGFFNDAKGTVLAQWDAHRVCVRIPFDSEESAETSRKGLVALLKKDDSHIAISRNDNILTIYTVESFGEHLIDRNRQTPHRHTWTDNPSAVGFARFDLGYDDVADAYFELAPTHGRLEVQFKDNSQNMAKIVEMLKSLIFKLL